MIFRTDNIRHTIIFSFFVQGLLLTHSTVMAQTGKGACVSEKRYLSADSSKYIMNCAIDNGLGDIVREAIIEGGSSNEKKCLITMKEYDQFRRPSRTWLPAPLNMSVANSQLPDRLRELSDGEITNAVRDFNSDTKPFTLSEYDKLYTSQVAKTVRPGSDWHDRDKATTNLTVYAHEVSFSAYNEIDVVLITPSGKEYVSTTVKDEDGNEVTTLSDITGQTYFTISAAGKTAYVYDYKGRLTYVLPPVMMEHVYECLSHNKGSLTAFNETDEWMKKYAYIYKHDFAGRCIYKKLPGCEPVFYLYDAAGNCVLTQDGNQREKGKWMFTIPDKFGRMCLKGLCKATFNYKNEPLHNVFVYAEYNRDNEACKKYDVHGISIDGAEVLEADYYDNYDFIAQNDYQFGYRDIPDCEICSGKGLLTGQVVAYFDNRGVLGHNLTTFYYDDKRRVVQSHQSVYQNANLHTQTDYSFTGKPIKVNTVYERSNSNTICETTTYSYDHAERLIDVSHQVNNSDRILIVHNTYDELGRRKTSQFPNNLPKIEYSYNIQSALKEISMGSLFSETLLYNENDNGNTPLWGGKISSVSWNNSRSSVPKGTYNYEYDKASRLSSASFIADGNSQNNPDFSTSYEYDRNGNITTLTRAGLNDLGEYGEISKLTYGYDGNQLKAVKDDYQAPSYNGYQGFRDDENESDTEYTYDANGNMTGDKNKRIRNIEYNFLNLPALITFDNGNSIMYVYDAKGTKLRAEYHTALSSSVGDGKEREREIRKSERKDAMNNIEYIGNLMLKGDECSYLRTENGMVIILNRRITGRERYPNMYTFNITDHLGNVRAVVSLDGRVIETNDYYPYGMLMNGGATSVQPFKYSGKELDRMHGLNWYDHGARMSDPALGRWHVVDPLCEKFYDVSPYALCGNDPVNYVDNDGREIILGNNCSQEFAEQYNNAISYLKEHNAAQVWEQLNNRPEKIIINENTEKANYALGNDVFWNPFAGLYTSSEGNGYRLSPAIRLLHELGHKLQEFTGEYDISPDNSVWQSKEEKRNILEVETPAAIQCGEIPQNAKSRDSHSGVSFKTTSSTSTIIINPDDPDVKMMIMCWE